MQRSNHLHNCPTSPERGGVGSLKGIKAHVLKAKSFGGEGAGVTSDEDVIVVHDEWADEPERGD